MDKYGSDKPDLRIDLVLQDATEVMADCGFGPFEGQTVKAIVVDGFTATRLPYLSIDSRYGIRTNGALDAVLYTPYFSNTGGNTSSRMQEQTVLRESFISWIWRWHLLPRRTYSQL